MNVSDPGATKSGRADYEGRSVLVTGADGFIGSHLTEALVEAGANVTALCLYNAFDAMGWIDDLPKPVRASVNAVRGDVRDAALMQSLAARQEVIFHLAALIAIPYSYAAAQSYVDTNILGTLNVLEAARAHDVARACPYLDERGLRIGAGDAHRRNASPAGAIAVFRDQDRRGYARGGLRAVA